MSFFHSQHLVFYAIFTLYFSYSTSTSDGFTSFCAFTRSLPLNIENAPEGSSPSEAFYIHILYSLNPLPSGHIHSQHTLNNPHKEYHYQYRNQT